MFRVKANLRPYLISICQFFGFGFTFPLGKFLVEWAFEDQAPRLALLLSLASLVLATILLIFGGIIADRGVKNE